VALAAFVTLTVAGRREILTQLPWNLQAHTHSDARAKHYAWNRLFWIVGL